MTVGEGFAVVTVTMITARQIETANGKGDRRQWDPKKKREKIMRQ